MIATLFATSLVSFLFSCTSLHYVFCSWSWSCEPKSMFKYCLVIYWWDGLNQCNKALWIWARISVSNFNHRVLSCFLVESMVNSIKRIFISWYTTFLFDTLIELRLLSSCWCQIFGLFLAVPWRSSSLHVWTISCLSSQKFINHSSCMFVQSQAEQMICNKLLRKADMIGMFPSQ